MSLRACPAIHVIALCISCMHSCTAEPPSPCTAFCSKPTSRVWQLLQSRMGCLNRVICTGWPRLQRLRMIRIGRYPMKTKFISAAVLAVSLVGLGGCANMDRQTVGTVGGAVAGGLVGSAIGGTGATIAGAAVGGVIGNQVGKR